MQQIEQYKSQKLSHFSQMIILDEAAHIIDSCNSIFSTQAFQGKPFTEYFPFLESIYPHLLELEIGGEELRFAKIEAPLEELPGVYDFTFARVQLDERPCILWSIYDYTSLYEDFKQYQQRRNELEMHREMLEIRNRQLRRQKDLLTQKNLVLQNWNEVRKDYYEKVRLALESPINALDGLSFILANLSDAAHQDYISALRATIRHLQDIVTEFQLITTIDGENEPSEIQTFDPHLIFEQVLTKLQALSAQQQGVICSQIAPDIPHNLSGNPRHLQQILHQLLLNAQKHQAGVNLLLQIDGNSPNANAPYLLRIQIVDQPNDAATASQKAPQEAQAQEADLIFRLSLVKKLIELEGGHIQVKNRTDGSGLILECLLRYPLVE